MNTSKNFSALALSLVLLPLLTGADGGGCGDPEPIGGDTPVGEGGAPGGGDGGSTTSDGGSGNLVCDDFNNAVPENPLTVTVRNERAEPIYLGDIGACATPSLFAVSKEGDIDVLGGSENLEPGRNERSTCERPLPAPPPSCTQYPAIRIEPGGYYVGTWSGRLYEQVTPPAACDLPERDEEACYRAYLAPASVYRVESTSYLTAHDCEGSACDCPAGSPGSSCVLQSNNAVFGEPIQASSTVDYPTEVTAEIVFR